MLAQVTNKRPNCLPRRLTNCQVNTLHGLIAVTDGAAGHKTANPEINGVKGRTNTHFAVTDHAGGGADRLVSKNPLDSFDPIRRNDAVGVEPADNFAAGGVKTTITGVNDSLARFG